MILRFEEEEKVLKEKMILLKGNKKFAEKMEWGRRIWLRGRNPDDYFQRPAHPDDHLQKAIPFGIVICKRPAHPDDHLQKAGLSG